MSMRFLIIGAGYSGLAIARELSGRADAMTGTTRSRDKFERLRSAGIEPALFSREEIDPLVREQLTGATHLVIAAGPDTAGDAALDLLADDILAAPGLGWIGYLSTVGVYGDHEGGWVDETTECRPRPGRSDDRLAVEQGWEKLAARKGVPLAILRLSGIYGPGRNAFLNLERGTARRIVKDGQVFNRIHLDDIAGATAFLAEKRLGGVYNVTDEEPSPPQDVVTYAAGLMGVEPPPETAFEAADMSPMALSFWGEVKRVSNGKLRDAGYVFRQPNYRAALDDMWGRGRWRS